MTETLNKIDGRTRAGRAAKSAASAAAVQDLGEENILRTNAVRGVREEREPVRRTVREDEGEVLGRNGEVLSRKRVGGVDPFHIPPEIVPKGWDYQWNVVSVTGNTEIVLDQGLGMYENGWRPVPAERHPGLFIARGKRGDIIRGGQRLEERPLALTQRARAEDLRNARQLITDRNDSLKLSGVKKSMPDGFDMSQRYRNTGANVNISIDKALDIPSPSYEVAEDQS